MMHNAPVLFVEGSGLLSSWRLLKVIECFSCKIEILAEKLNETNGSHLEMYFLFKDYKKIKKKNLKNKILKSKKLRNKKIEN